MVACFSKLKVLPSFYISYTIPDNVTASNIQHKQIYFDQILYSTGSPPLIWFPNNTVFQTSRFILILSFVHLVLYHSTTYTVFCLHISFSKVSKNSVSRGPPTGPCIFPRPIFTIIYRPKKDTTTFGCIHIFLLNFHYVQ